MSIMPGHHDGQCSQASPPSVPLRGVDFVASLSPGVIQRHERPLPVIDRINAIAAQSSHCGRSCSAQHFHLGNGRVAGLCRHSISALRWCSIRSQVQHCFRHATASVATAAVQTGFDSRDPNRTFAAWLIYAKGAGPLPPFARAAIASAENPRSCSVCFFPAAADSRFQSFRSAKFFEEIGA